MTVSIQHALDIIDIHTAPLSTQIIPIENALGRILRENMIASFDLPRFDNSAMDGYAVKSADANSTVVCTDVIYAGDNPQMTLNPKSCIKIMTGAPLPQGCEAIVPIENVISDEINITLPPNIKPNAHIRYAGEDIKSGTIYLHQGDAITAYSIALLASQGITHIKVTRPIKVCVFGTGDELRPHYEKIAPHQLYNSNTPMFLARSESLGCETYSIGSSGDTLEAIKISIKEALHADIILTSGGVSMGDKDFTKEAFRGLGMHSLFQKIEIKPGKPTSFGKIDTTLIVNLAGNPLASMVNYELFVRPMIAKLSGATSYYHHPIETVIREDLRVNKGKHTVLLGDFDGKSFNPFSKQQAGMISPLTQADGMIITTPEVEFLAKGTTVKMIPIKWERCGSIAEDLFSS